MSSAAYFFLSFFQPCHVVGGSRFDLARKRAPFIEYGVRSTGWEAILVPISRCGFNGFYFCVYGVGVLVGRSTDVYCA